MYIIRSRFNQKTVGKSLELVVNENKGDDCPLEPGIDL